MPHRPQPIAVWHELEKCATIQITLRAAQRALGRMRTTIDDHDYFAYFRYPERFQEHTFRNEVKRVVAIATSPAETWFPTAQQQTDRVREWQVGGGETARANERRAIERVGR